MGQERVDIGWERADRDLEMADIGWERADMGC